MITEYTLPSGDVVRFDKEDHTYDLRVEHAQDQFGWIRVPSVTSILNVYNKPALPWWGMQIGVEGVVRLCTDHGKTINLTPNAESPRAPEDIAAEIVAALTEHKLTVNHVKRSAADRGISVHEDLQNFAQVGVDFADATPYHEAAHSFLREKAPVSIGTELIVASFDDGWAGTADSLCIIEGEKWLLDYKTSKRVYDSHYAQLAFYKEGLVECGYIEEKERKTLRCGIVLLQASGKYKLVENQHVGAYDVQNLLAGYRGYQAMQPPKKGMKL